MDMVEIATKAFIKVRDRISCRENPEAYRLAYEKPLKFYLEHTTEEAINILVIEAERKSEVQS